jgi:glycosyltransferase involved in cell wall biosynthesis
MSSETLLPQTTAAQASKPAEADTMRLRAHPIVLVYVIDNMGLGGTELNAVRTSERLNRERFELRIVCLSEDGPLTERYRALGVPVVNMPIRSFYGWSMFRSGLRFARYVHQTRAEIVHAHDVYSNIFVWVWARLGGARVVIASRRWWNSLPSRKLRIGNRFAFARASAVLANSEQVRDTVVREGVPANRVWTITNFADDGAFGVASHDERKLVRESWNASAAAVVIGCVARFHPVKDHVTLVRAFAHLRARHHDVFLVLVGDGPTRPDVEALVSNLNLDSVVHFTGELNNRHNYHRGFDVSALSSRSEGFPNSLVEAMAAGNPVVATAVGGNSDAVLDGTTGFLVPPGDPKAFADALERLVVSPALRESAGQAGLLRARQMYSATHVLAGLEKMYLSLVEAAR